MGLIRPREKAVFYCTNLRIAQASNVSTSKVDEHNLEFGWVGAQSLDDDITAKNIIMAHVLLEESCFRTNNLFHDGFAIWLAELAWFYCIHRLPVDILQ